MAEAGTSFMVGGGPGVAANARAAIEPLRKTLGDSVAGDLALLLSELVTNSYRHSGAGDQPIGVDVRIGRDAVRCEVTDQGRGFDGHPVPASERGVGGWGLYIVDELSDRWGVRPGPPSRVWFELGLRD